MTQPFILSPRYRLDDESEWLEGVDPARNYWILVNGCQEWTIKIPGLSVSSMEEWKENILRFRGLNSKETMKIDRAASEAMIYCISNNCYAIETEVMGAPAWHLFDRETLETLLMTSHLDWLPSDKDIALGRKLLALAFEQPVSV